MRSLKSFAASSTVLARVSVAALSLALAACGSAAIPVDKLASSEAALQSARAVGAENTPKAALHVRLAEEQITTARALIQEGENERAASILSRAEADANLALSVARGETAREEANELMETVQKAKKAAGKGGQ